MKISKEDLVFVGYLAASAVIVVGIFAGWIFLTIESEKWVNAWIAH